MYQNIKFFLSTKVNFQNKYEKESIFYPRRINKFQFVVELVLCSLFSSFLNFELIFFRIVFLHSIDLSIFENELNEVFLPLCLKFQLFFEVVETRQSQKNPRRKKIRPMMKPSVVELEQLIRVALLCKLTTIFDRANRIKFAFAHTFVS